MSVLRAVGNLATLQCYLGASLFLCVLEIPAPREQQQQLQRAIIFECQQQQESWNLIVHGDYNCFIPTYYVCTFTGNI